MFTTSNLSTAALVCGAACVLAVFLDWAVPKQSAVEMFHETVRQHAEGEQIDPRRQAQIAAAYPLQGMDEPFHGVAFIAICVFAVAFVVAGVSLAKVDGRAKLAEGLLRAGGAAFVIAFGIAMMSSASEVFPARERAVGLWLAMGASLAAGLCATFASAKLAPPPQS